jgi:predicted Rossmann fold nucleotide-binding protein DprA/Smf involved in DNA uptake
MATEFVNATVRDIDNRLAELKGEVERLEAARSALVGTRRGPGRPRGSTNSSSSSSSPRRGRRPGRPRGRRGGNTRARQTLELVQQRPGITIPEIAEAMKIEPNYLYRVLPKLVQDGQVRRDGKGWHPVDGADAA